MDEKKKYFCRNCKGLRNHTSLHKVEQRGGDEDDYIQWNEEFHMIECDVCDTISFLKVYGDSQIADYTSDGNIEYYVDNTIDPNV